MPKGGSRSRYDELKQILQGRLWEAQSDLKEKLRGFRNNDHDDYEVDSVGRRVVDIQDETEFKIIGMQAATLEKIHDALRRLELGLYANCAECGDEIAEKRLRALPFAVRCKDCEEAMETAEQGYRQQGTGRSRDRQLSLLDDVAENAA